MLTALAVLAATACQLVIENGTLVDGTGRPARAADVAVCGDRIGKIGGPGSLAKLAAERRIDARGLIVAPGFVDVLSPGVYPFTDGEGAMLNKILQGVTTDILGEGWTAAPTDPDEPDERFAGDRSFDAWLRAMDGNGNAINVASLVGHSSIRKAVMGSAPGPANAEQLARMKGIARRAMEDGALGLGAALIYPPGSFASPAEILEVVKAIAPFGGVYALHLRSEGDRLLEAAAEAIDIAREAKLPLQIFHLKAMGPRNWHKLDALIARIEVARASGVDVAADTFPYLHSATMLSALLPPWASADGKLLERLDDPAQRAKLRAALLGDDPSWENLGSLVTPQGVTVVSAPGADEWLGRSLADVAKSMGTDWAEAAVRLLATTRGKGMMLLKTMDEPGLRKRLRLPWVYFGTDAGERFGGEKLGHPRAMGTFPRVLGTYVRELKVLTLEQAVRRASHAPAERFGLKDRGVVREGTYADIAIFDFKSIDGRATIEEPGLFPVGMKYVLVNGALVLDDGKQTSARPGRALRGRGWKPAK